MRPQAESFVVFVDEAFLAASGGSDLPSQGRIHVVGAPDEIEPWISGSNDGSRTAILLSAPFEDAVSAIAARDVWSWRVLVTGAPSRRAFLRVAPWLETPQPALEMELVRSYAEKSAALSRLEVALVEANVQRPFVNGIVTAADECLQNAIFDAHPVLSTGERRSDFDLDPPVELGFEIDDGLVTVAVRDPYGTFDRASFNAALLRHHGRGADASPRGGEEARGLRIGFAFMLRNSSALSVEVQDGRSTTVRLVTDTRQPFRRFLGSGKVLDFVSWGE